MVKMKNKEPGYMKRKESKQICIMCQKRNTDGTLFCDICSQEDIFARMLAFKNSEKFKKGWFAKGEHNGRLPTRQEREWAI